MPVVERHEREAHRRPRRQHAQRHLGDHAERAFGSDEQIDEVHRRRGEIAGRQLRHVRHPIRRHRNARRAVGQHDVEEPVAAGLRPSALDVEHVAVGQHDGQRPHPVARRAVFERGGARRVGGDDAADECAGEGGHGRIVTARPSRAPRRDRASVTPASTRTQSWPRSRIRLRRDVLSRTSPIGVAPPVSDDWAPIGRTAGTERTSAATSASDAGRGDPRGNPPGKCAASSRNDASTSGSRPIGGGEPAGPQGNRARIA